MENIGGRDGELPGEFPPLDDDILKRNKSEPEKLVFHVVFDSAEHPDLALERGVNGLDVELELLVEDRISASTVDYLGRKGIAWIAGKGDLGVDILFMVDTDVLDVSSLLDVNLELLHGPRWRLKSERSKPGIRNSSI